MPAGDEARWRRALRLTGVGSAETPGAAPTTSTFRRGFASTLVLDVAARGMSAITTVLLVRSLSTASFALIVLFLGIGQFGSSAATGGIRTGYLRAEAERVSRGTREPTSFYRALLSSFGLVLAGGLFGAAGMALIGVDGSAAEAIAFVTLVTVFTAGHSAIELAMSHHQAHLAFRRAGLVGMLRSAVMLVVSIAVLAGLIRSGQAVALWMTIAVAAAAASSCWSLAAATRKGSRRAKGETLLGAEASWLTVYFIVRSGIYYVPIFLAAALLGDEAVASYGAALRYIAVVLGPLPALLAVLRVRTSQHDIIDSSQRQSELLLQWLKRSTVPVLTLLALAAVAAPLVIPWIDEGRYPDSIPIFQLGLVGAFLAYATLPGTNLLMAQARYRQLALVSTAALIMKVGMAIAAARSWGVVGIAATSAIASTVEDSATTYLSLRAPRSVSRH